MSLPSIHKPIVTYPYAAVCKLTSKRNIACLIAILSVFAAEQGWASNTKLSSTLSAGFYQISYKDRPSESFYILAAKAKYGSWRFGLSQPYVRDSQGVTGLANATFSAKYQWDFDRWQIEWGVKQRLATASRKVTLPVKDSGLFASLSTMWDKTYLYIDAGYWWREETHLNRKNSEKWELGGFYPIKKKHWIGLGIDQSESAIRHNKETFVSTYWQAKLNARYQFNLVLSKGLTAQSPDYFAGLQLNRRF